MASNRFEEDNESAGMYINEDDGLPALAEADCADFQSIMDQADPADDSYENLLNDEDLPTSLTVTNVFPGVFTDDDCKEEFESLFRRFGEPVYFYYFKSFKRVRASYKKSAHASRARIQMNQFTFRNNVMNCYYVQPITPVDVADRFLQLPPPVKQFLISPPSSPPEGWEPKMESSPVINYELLAAISSLKPGSSYELHTPQEPSQPSIVVHVCGSEPVNKSAVIPQTKRPPVMSQ